VHHIFGVMTLRQLLEMYADHGERHIAQILELRRRLDIPSPMTVLLPTLDY
jgi:plasmid replication initiation protein